MNCVTRSAGSFLPLALLQVQWEGGAITPAYPMSMQQMANDLLLLYADCSCLPGGFGLSCSRRKQMRKLFKKLYNASHHEAGGKKRVNLETEGF